MGKWFEWRFFKVIGEVDIRIIVEFFGILVRAIEEKWRVRVSIKIRVRTDLFLDIGREYIFLYGKMG